MVAAIPAGAPLSGPDSDAVDRREIDAIWKQVQERVTALAGGDPNKIRKNLDINGVLFFIEQAETKEKKKSEKYGPFKNAVAKTLQCIQTVGGIVASGASQVRIFFSLSLSFSFSFSASQHHG
jgi:hypothetical protein